MVNIKTIPAGTVLLHPRGIKYPPAQHTPAMILSLFVTPPYYHNYYRYVTTRPLHLAIGDDALVDKVKAIRKSLCQHITQLGLTPTSPHEEYLVSSVLTGLKLDGICDIGMSDRHHNAIVLTLIGMAALSGGTFCTEPTLPDTHLKRYPMTRANVNELTINDHAMACLAVAFTEKA